MWATRPWVVPVCSATILIRSCRPDFTTASIGFALREWQTTDQKKKAPEGALWIFVGCVSAPLTILGDNFPECGHQAADFLIATARLSLASSRARLPPRRRAYSGDCPTALPMS